MEAVFVLIAVCGVTFYLNIKFIRNNTFSCNKKIIIAKKRVIHD